jgi:hypothetical protein
MTRYIGSVGFGLILFSALIAIMEMIYAAYLGIVDFYTPNFVYPMRDFTNIDLMGPVMILMVSIGFLMIGISKIIRKV